MQSNQETQTNAEGVGHPKREASLAAPNGYAADAAQKAVRAVIKELKGRKGFSWWWDDIGQYQQDIIECAAREVEKVLKPHTEDSATGSS